MAKTVDKRRGPSIAVSMATHPETISMTEGESRSVTASKYGSKLSSKAKSRLDFVIQNVRSNYNKNQEL